MSKFTNRRIQLGAFNHETMEELRRLEQSFTKYLHQPMTKIISISIDNEVYTFIGKINSIIEDYTHLGLFRPTFKPYISVVTSKSINTINLDIRFSQDLERQMKEIYDEQN